MQSLSECIAEERRYQSMASAEDLATDDPDSSPAPPSYTAEATTTPWTSRALLPPDSEMACGISLDSIPEDGAGSGSTYHMPVFASPRPVILEALADYETLAIRDSDHDRDETLAELTMNEPMQATGVSFRVRPAYWAPSPIVRARELIDPSRSEFTHRRVVNTRPGSYHSNAASGRSRSRDGTPSRRQSADNPPSRGGSRQNSDSTNRHHGSYTPASPWTMPNDAEESRRVIRGRSGETFIPPRPDVRADVSQATAQPHGYTFVDDCFPGWTARDYPPTYSPITSLQSPTIPERPLVPPNSPASSNLADLAAPSQQAANAPSQPRPYPSTTVAGAPANANRTGAFCNVYMHANYSNPTIYPSIVSAAGLNYGTPFGSPLTFAATIPQMSPRAALGQIPAPSRSSTGNVPLHAALDAMQSPSLGPVPVVGADPGEAYVAVDMFAAASAWKPSWDVFPLKVYRGYDLKVVEVQRTWDDEDLLRALGAAYDTLRGRLRKYFSFMDVWYVTMVAAENQFVFPQRVGPAKISAHRNMRMRYLLAHPAHMKGQHEIMRALTARRGYGVEFVEQAQLGRMALFIGSLFLISLAIAVVYGARTGDWIGGFTIGSFFGQNFALPAAVLQVAVSCWMREW